MNKHTTKKYAMPSEQVQEVMSNVPGGLIRWGISIITLIILLVLVGAWFFKYPDIIRSEITINMEQSPAVIKARSTGKIVALLVTNQAVVEANTALAVIENPAVYTDVLWLDTCLSKMHLTEAGVKQSIASFSDTLLRLGALQEPFSNYIVALEDYQRYQTIEYHKRKIQLKEDQIKARKLHLLEMMEQRRLLKGQLSNAEAVYRRDSALFARGVVSEEALETSKNSRLKVLQSLSALNATIKESEVETTQIQDNILDLDQDDREQESHYSQALRRAHQQLRAQLKAWQQAYLLVSPIKGTVNLMGNWSLNQNVIEGETVFTIMPSGLSTPIGKALVPTTGSGKVIPGQWVQVHLNNYPDKEFGFIKGMVRSLSDVPLKDGQYVAEIVFPDGLTTNYSYTIPAQGTLSGYADIITEDVRLLKRIVMPVTRLVKKHY